MDPMGIRSRRFLRLSQGVVFVFLAAFFLHAAFWRGKGLDGFFNDWVYNGLVVVSAISAIARGVLRRADRAAWLLFGASLALWAAGELSFTVYVSGLADPPYPSI